MNSKKCHHLKSIELPERAATANIPLGGPVTELLKEGCGLNIWLLLPENSSNGCPGRSARSSVIVISTCFVMP